MDKFVKILSQEAMTPVIFRMVLDAKEVAEKAVPGQFVNLYCKDRSRLLPRPISICDVDKEAGTLTLIYAVVGKGTEEFAAMKAGEEIRVLGPLGHGFDLSLAEDKDEIRIVGGGLGMPPLVYLTKALIKQGVPAEKILIYLGFRDEAWMGEEFAGMGKMFLSSDHDESMLKGNVVDRMRQSEKDGENTQGKSVLYTCGPIPMMRAIQNEYMDRESMELQFSLEERMGCGIGACAGCPAKLKMPDGTIKQQGVCKMGPVFDGKAVIFK